MNYKDVRIVKKSNNHFEVETFSYWYIPPLYCELGPVGGGSGYAWALHSIHTTLSKARKKKQELLNMLKEGKVVE